MLILKFCKQHLHELLVVSFSHWGKQSTQILHKCEFLFEGQWPRSQDKSLPLNLLDVFVQGPFAGGRMFAQQGAFIWGDGWKAICRQNAQNWAGIASVATQTCSFSNPRPQKALVPKRRCASRFSFRWRKQQCGFWSVSGCRQQLRFYSLERCVQQVGQLVLSAFPWKMFRTYFHYVGNFTECFTIRTKRSSQVQWQILILRK